MSRFWAAGDGSSSSSEDSSDESSTDSSSSGGDVRGRGAAGDNRWVMSDDDSGVYNILNMHNSFLLLL